MPWFRVDNRLIHGQIIEAWLPYTRAKALVVANAELAANPLTQDIAMLAVPSRIHTDFVALEELPPLLARYARKKTEFLALFADCQDARKAWDLGVRFAVCNVGNLHYGKEKKQILPHVALSIEDENCLRYLERQGVALDFRSIPADKPEFDSLDEVDL